MTVASGGFINALRYGAMIIEARFQVYTNGVPVGTPYEAALSTGTVTLDRNSNQRRTASITVEFDPTVPPPVLLPANPQALLAPFGNEVFLECGLAVPSQPINWVPLGLFAIATSNVEDTTVDLVCTLDLYDRSWIIAQRTFRNPYNFPATSSGNFVDEMIALLNQVWGQDPTMAPLQYNIVPTTQTVPVASYNQGSDPWQAVMDMAAAVGYEMYFDAYGTVTGKPIPDPTTQPITWNYTDNPQVVFGAAGTGEEALLGSPYSTPAAITVEMTRDGIYNDIVIQGTGTANAATYTGTGTQASGPATLATAADNNPQSPTFIGGPMGNVPDFVSTSLVDTAGAQAMANTDLSVALSSSWIVTLTGPPNPILDVDDVVSVTRPRVGLSNHIMVLDTITHVINYADLMSITGRVIGQAL